MRVMAYQEMEPPKTSPRRKRKPPAPVDTTERINTRLDFSGFGVGKKFSPQHRVKDIVPMDLSSLLSHSDESCTVVGVRTDVVRPVTKVPKTPGRSCGIRSCPSPSSPSLSFSSFPAALPQVPMTALDGPTTPPSFASSCEQSSFSSLEGASPPPVLRDDKDFSAQLTPIKKEQNDCSGVLSDPEYQEQNTSALSSSTASTSRPLPDQSAFDTSQLSFHSKKSTPQRSPVCPPTPMRTPTWAHRSLDSGVPALVKMERKSSLSTTKMLFNLQASKGFEGGRNRLLQPDFFYSGFENLGKIGAGAFSEVFKMRSRADGKIYAVKKAKHQFRSKRDRERMLAEVRMYEKLEMRNKMQCEYVMKYYRAWQEDGYFCTMTEYCELGNLRESIDNMNSPFPERTIWTFIHDLARGLDYIHSAGIVHLDIKPQNIFISIDGVLKIGDLGLAAEAGSEEDGHEGDNQYMAKELLTSSVKSPSADIFSFGLMIYELAAHVDLPLEGEPWHSLRDGNVPALTPRRSQGLDLLVHQMLHPVPSLRPSAKSILQHPLVQDAAENRDTFVLTLPRYKPSRMMEEDDAGANFLKQKFFSSIPEVEETTSLSSLTPPTTPASTPSPQLMLSWRLPDRV